MVPDSSPLAGKRAYFAVASVSHDFGEQNNIGFIYTGREFAGFFNRVGGIYANFRINKNWTSWLRSVVSSTACSPSEPGPVRMALEIKSFALPEDRDSLQQYLGAGRVAKAA